MGMKGGLVYHTVIVADFGIQLPTLVRPAMEETLGLKYIWVTIQRIHYLSLTCYALSS